MHQNIKTSKHKYVLHSIYKMPKECQKSAKRKTWFYILSHFYVLIRKTVVHNKVFVTFVDQLTYLRIFWLWRFIAETRGWTGEDFKSCYYLLSSNYTSIIKPACVRVWQLITVQSVFHIDYNWHNWQLTYYWLDKI